MNLYPKMGIVEFLKVLFGQKQHLEEDFIAMTQIIRDETRTKILTHRFQSYGGIVDYVYRFRSKANIFYNLATQKEDLGVKQRGTWRNCFKIIGYNVDLDVHCDELGQSKILPKTKEEAYEKFCEVVGYEPTITVDSGNGLQPLFLFETPYIITCVQDIYEIQLRLLKFGTGVQSVFKSKYGFALDPVFNVDRVFRCPGSLNLKTRVPKECTVYKYTELRYTLDAPLKNIPEVPLPNSGPFREMMTELKMKQEEVPLQPLKKRQHKLTTEIEHLKYKVNLDVEVSSDLIDQLKEVSRDFAAAWDRADYDARAKKNFDVSPSSYDMRIANAAHAAGCRDQQIVDLLIIFRRRHYSHLEDWAHKLVDPTQLYLKCTVEASKEKNAKDIAARKMAELAIEGVKEKDPATIDKQKKYLSTQLGFEIGGILKLIGDKKVGAPSYEIITGAGNIEIPSADHLTQQGKLRGIIAGAINIMIPRFKPEDWHYIAQCLLNICQEHSLGDIEEEAIVMGYIQTMIASKSLQDDWTNARSKKEYPFRKDGQIYIFRDGIFRYMVNQGEVMSRTKIANCLRKLGFERKEFNIDDSSAKSGRTKVYVYKVER